MEAVVVLHRVGFLKYFCPKQGQDFKHSTALLLWQPIIGQVSPRDSTIYVVQETLDVVLTCLIMFITAVCMIFLLEGQGFMANAIWVELTSSTWVYRVLAYRFSLLIVFLWLMVLRRRLLMIPKIFFLDFSASYKNTGDLTLELINWCT